MVAKVPEALRLESFELHGVGWLVPTMTMTVTTMGWAVSPFRARARGLPAARGVGPGVGEVAATAAYRARGLLRTPEHCWNMDLGHYLPLYIPRSPTFAC